MQDIFPENAELEQLRTEISSSSRKDRAKAIKLAEEGVKKAKELGRQDYAAIFLAMKATLLSHDGRRKEAIAVGEEAMRLAREVESAEAIVTAAAVLMDLYYSSGMMNELQRVRSIAERYVNQARERTRFRFWNVVAILFFDMGKIGLAEKHWSHCLSIARRMNDERLLAVVYNNLGEVYKIRGQYEKALEHYRKAYGYSQKIEDYAGMAINLLNMADVFRKMGIMEEAEKYLRDSWKLYEKHRSPKVGAAPLRDLSKLLASQGRIEEAMELVKKGVELAEKSGDKKKMGELLLAKGYVEEEAGNLSTAIKSYLEAMRLFESVNDRVGAAECEVYIFRSFMKSGKKEAATMHLRRAKKLAEEIGDFYLLQVIGSLEKDFTAS